MRTGALLFDKGGKIALDFRADTPITLRSLKLYPAHHAIQTAARLLVKEGNNYRVLSEFQLDRSNANLNVGFEPYAPVVLSVSATTASDFRLELDGVAPQSGLSEVVFSSAPVVERYPEKTIWLYTGYRWEEIRDLEVMAYVDVVVDGRYIQEERDVTLEWKGSANQRVIDVPMTRKLGQIVLHA